MTSLNSSQFDMKRVTTSILIHLLGKKLRFPRLSLLKCKLTLNRLKGTVDSKFPRDFVDLAASPAWVYRNLRENLPDAMIFDRGGSGRRISDGRRECTFIWELRDAA